MKFLSTLNVFHRYRQDIDIDTDNRYRYRQNYFQIYTEGKRTRIVKTILKNNKSGIISIPNLKTFTATGIQMMSYW